MCRQKFNAMTVMSVLYVIANLFQHSGMCMTREETVTISAAELTFTRRTVV